MIVPFNKSAQPQPQRSRPQVKSQYLQMAASQMQQEGKFQPQQPPSTDATSSAAIASTQGTPLV